MGHEQTGNVMQGRAIQMNEAETATIRKAPLRNIRTWRPELAVDRRPDGTIYVRQAGELGAYPGSITSRLAHWATAAPDRIFLADRNGPHDAWRRTDITWPSYPRPAKARRSHRSLADSA